MSSLLVNILSPSGLVFEGEVSSLYVPSSSGPLGILPGHTPIIASLDPKGGLLRIVTYEGEKLMFAIASGALEVKKEKTIVLTEKAVKVASEEDGQEALNSFREYREKEKSINEDVKRAQAKIASSYSMGSKESYNNPDSHGGALS